jgi:hypothetical protein
MDSQLKLVGKGGLSQDESCKNESRSRKSKRNSHFHLESSLGEALHNGTKAWDYQWAFRRTAGTVAFCANLI